MSNEKADKIAVLSEDYDLSLDSDVELARTLKRLCNEYEMCRYCISTATGEVWNGIVRVAREIVRREAMQSNTTDMIELEALVKAELEYPEKWDTAAYPTVWHALWEAFCWLNGDRR